MSKTDGIGVLSLSLDFLHIRRWICDNAQDATSPTTCVAVNFDDPAPVTSSIVELPSGEVSKRDDVGRVELWHGLRLTSLADILHVELRGTATGPPIASFSAPVTRFLEDAFLESEGKGTTAEFSLNAVDEEVDKKLSPLDTAPASADFSSTGVALAQFRVKFHLQIDILRALCDGVGIDVDSVDSMKEYAPQVTAVVGAADGLVTARRNSLGHEDSKNLSQKTVNAFDKKAAAQEREESLLFKKFNKSDSGFNTLGHSYTSLTAGVRRFLSSQKKLPEGAWRDERASNLVRLLSDQR